MRKLPTPRSSAIDKAKAYLLQTGMPRIQMAFMVLMTGASGFLLSFLMLQAGVTRIWIRYPLAVALAYGVFLLSLWLWLTYQRGRLRLDTDVLDLPGIDVRGTGTGHSGPKPFEFGGARTGGGGAGGVFDGGGIEASSAALDSGIGAEVGSGGAGLDLDELLILHRQRRGHPPAVREQALRRGRCLRGTGKERLPGPPLSTQECRSARRQHQYDLPRSPSPGPASIRLTLTGGLK